MCIIAFGEKCKIIIVKVILPTIKSDIISAIDNWISNDDKNEILLCQIAFLFEIAFAIWRVEFKVWFVTFFLKSSYGDCSIA